VIPEWHAAFHEPTPLKAFAAIEVPTLFLTGTRSKPSARAVARLLTATLPGARVEEIEGVGHMAPVTHPNLVNPLIERFLAR
jgi:pimeloyl-ACP methyl ester carboxylesterase